MTSMKAASNIMPKKRVAILLDHQGANDTRVLNSADLFQNAGFEVRIFALDTIDPQRLQTNDQVQGHYRTLIGLHTNGPSLIYCLLRSVLKTLMRFNIFARPFQMKRSILCSLEASSSTQTADLPNIVQPITPSNFQKIVSNLLWHIWLVRNFKVAISLFRPDVLIANDLSMLGLGATLSRRLCVPLIYDAHELEAGRNNITQDLAERVRQSFERMFVKQAHTVTTVSETIATVLARRYKIQRPTVLLNISPDTKSSTAFTRIELGLPETGKLVIYVGSLQIGRGLTHLIEAVAMDPAAHLVLVGPGTESRVETLKTKAYKLGASIFVLEPVASNRVKDLIAISDVSVLPLQNVCASYRLSLPNKLFQSLQTGTPIISTPMPEIASVLQTLNTGQVSDDFDAKSLGRALQVTASKQCVARSLPDAYKYETMSARQLEIICAALSSQPTPQYPRLPHWDKAKLSPVVETEIAKIKPSFLSSILSRVVGFYLLMGFN